MKKAVVDIDGILWNMANIWGEVIKRDYPNCPLPGNSTDKYKAKWHFYEGFMSEDQMAATVKEVHMRQHEFSSFQNAGALTKTLMRSGYHVTIASHRDPETFGPTERWLDIRNIPYNNLYIGFDKHFLLDDASVFIDDSPASQKRALEKEVTVFSIRYDYNEHVDGVNFFPDFFSLANGLTYWLREDK